jgi:hypothetical protein
MSALCMLLIHILCLTIRLCRWPVRVIVAGVMTPLLKTLALPIRAAVWTGKWVMGEYTEYDYFASDTPEVSCVTQAAESGRRTTRPPPTLGEAGNCMCGQCQYRRGYQTTLVVDTRVPPARRRKPVVAPRPTRRTRTCQSPPLPAKTTFELYRCWLNSRRRIYAGRIVTFLLGHQHAVENAVFNSAAVSAVIVARQMLGYSVPMLLIIPVCICSMLSFCAFRFLVAHYNAERNKAPVAAPVRVDQLANALPAIKGVWGMALRQQLTNFVGKSLHHHQMNDGLDEEYYISALLHKAGDKSAIGLALTTISRSPEMNGLMPMEFYLSRAKARRVTWERTYGVLEETESDRMLRDMLDSLNVRFEPRPEDVQALEYWRGVLANKADEIHSDVLIAEDAVKSFQDEIDRPAKEYYSLNTYQRLLYLQTHPAYAAAADRIEKFIEKMEKREEKMEKRRGKKPGASFDNLQFQRVEDMVVLNEVCDFVMTDVGAITEYHIECWKDRRMSLEENPASAYALLKQDALTLAASQKTFRADVEVCRLIATKDIARWSLLHIRAVCGPCKTPCNTAETITTPSDADFYWRISEEWVSLAQCAFTRSGWNRPGSLGQNPCRPEQTW